MGTGEILIPIFAWYTHGRYIASTDDTDSVLERINIFEVTAVKNLVICLVLCLASTFCCLRAGNCSIASTPPDFTDFWHATAVRVQAWPPTPQWKHDTVSFCISGSRVCQAKYFMPAELKSQRPVLYLLDRDAPESFEPGKNHPWMELDVRSLFRSAKPTPDLERQPYRLAVQTAIRSLDLLLGDRRHGMDRAGIVGGQLQQQS